MNDQHPQQTMASSDVPPAVPQRHSEHQYSPPAPVSPSTAVELPVGHSSLPSPPYAQHMPSITTTPLYNSQDYVSPTQSQQTIHPSPPIRETTRYSGELDVSSPIHYTRDPKKLIAYLVPFPTPGHLRTPQRFLIYTPPPPPFVDKPKEGEKEGRVHKVQRKWQDEIREAKTSDAKTMSWKGIKGKAIRGIHVGMGMTKTSNIEFLNRIGSNPQDEHLDAHDEHVKQEAHQTKATPKLEEMLLVYPSSMPGAPEQIREEFIRTMMRSKSKAERDAVIATGLLPVSAAIDILLTFIWPFGGLLEIDAVWAYSSIRGAKVSRSITRRLSSNSATGDHGEDKLQLNFTPSPRLAVLDKYLAARCREKEPDRFALVRNPPTETEVLEAIGWVPSAKGGQGRNWEDEQWEISEVKDDLQRVMTKGAREWVKWVKLFENMPEKALRK